MRLYVLAAVLSSASAAVMLRLWRTDLGVPFQYTTDAQGSAAHFVTTLETGWYESQPRLGFPYGQHYHDFPFSDDLHLVMAKILGWITGGNWVAAFNGYFLLTFPLAAVGAVWFLRQCRLTGPTTVVIAVLFSVAPYHLQRNEGHLFLSGYYLVPVAMVLVLRVMRGESLWGLRTTSGHSFPARARSVLTGRGAGTVVILGLLVSDGVYYAIFVLVLLAAAAVVALTGHHSWSRFGGAVTAGAVGVAWFAVAQVPDLLYAREHGSNAAAFSRGGDDAQRYALRLLGLLLPAQDHPIPALGELRLWFAGRYPPTGGYATLGVIGALGFVILLGVGLGRMMRSPGPVRPGPRAQTLGGLAGLTVVAVLVATVGGLGLVISLITPGMRAWFRFVIVITLLAQAAFGLALESWAARLRRRLAARRRSRTGGRATGRRLPTVNQIVLILAVPTLLLGVADQSLRSALQQPTTVASFHSDQAFFGRVEASLPVGAAVFQLPFRLYPESAGINGTTESDQLRGLLHTRYLKFSGGGIKGRPQTNWPKGVVGLPTATFVRDIAIVGFSGIIVDRRATLDQGSSILGPLRTALGPPSIVSDDDRWAYFSLDRIRLEIDASMTPEQQHVRSLQITHGAG